MPTLQAILIKFQLQDAKRSLHVSTEASKSHSSDLRDRAQDFQSRQADIDRRLRIVTQSETSDDAVRRFDSSMESLQKLEVAKGYMELLTEVEKLSANARANFKKSPQAALKPYSRLQTLVNALREAQPAAEDAAPHLIDHVDRTARTLWKQMKNAFASDFEATLKKMQWPGKDVILSGKLEQEWTEGVTKLLELQEPELNARDNQGGEAITKEEPLVLLPLEVMAKSLELRFKYHFEGQRPTNRLDKVSFLIGGEIIHKTKDGSQSTSSRTLSVY